ncbi:hypothetical protein BAE44_0016211 [Dichanthelium oligosanthes]|uniref:Uncharacterized protein n=1 Tax=Dichanthelium oligosanthes TaxID=888268 RepID=A0A1E5VCA7_9POAL|nr:hypothetical protein BAE44_0016211 [Dichanthelium oligosanthes]
MSKQSSSIYEPMMECSITTNSNEKANLGIFCLTKAGSLIRLKFKPFLPQLFFVIR